MIWFALMFGCNPACESNETLTADGCVPAADSAGWDEDTLPGHRLRECVLEAGDGRLDFQAGCASGVCWDTPYAEWASRFGQPDEIDGSGSSVRVEWYEAGVVGYFSDDNNDNLADDTSVPSSFFVKERAAGESVEGLRVDVSLACFVLVLGEPDDIDTEDGLIDKLWFDSVGVRVIDFTGPQSSGDPDGYVDFISFDEPR